MRLLLWLCLGLLTVNVTSAKPADEKLSKNTTSKDEKSLQGGKWEPGKSAGEKGDDEDLVVIGSGHGMSTSHEVSSEEGVGETGQHGPHSPDTHGDHEHHGNDSHHGNMSHSSHGGAHHGVHVASWQFEYVKSPLIISIFLIITLVSKMGFHHADMLSSVIPESCLLIVLGVIVGGVMYSSGGQGLSFAHLTPSLFFLFLLPPIILESAYSLHDRVFMDNLAKILLYAVVGTVLNCIFMAVGLFGLAKIGAMGYFEISLVQCFVFASFIVAVDPVAVLAIFQEIGVNNTLYFLVFGESLLNDAVTVVLYNMMKSFIEMEHIPPSQIGIGVAAFFVVSLGGLAVGIIFGIITSILTKYTSKVQVVEPLALFALAYTSYLVAELFHFSGIISIIGCGLVQAQYAFHNISHKSLTTVTYFSHMLAATSDCIIFMFLGLAVVLNEHAWHTGFVLWAMGLCLIFRFAIVYFLTYLVNKVDTINKIGVEEQFIMAYGGLRGAVAFCLVITLSEDILPHVKLFQTTTMVVIFFTVFVQGISIKPLVKLLRIRRHEKAPLCIYEEINYQVTDHLMMGVDVVLGQVDKAKFLEKLEIWDEKYFKQWLQRNPRTKDDTIMELYEKIALNQHLENIGKSTDKYGSTLELYKPETIRKPSIAPVIMDPDLMINTLDIVEKNMTERRASSPTPIDRAKAGGGFPKRPSLSPESDSERHLHTHAGDVAARRASLGNMLNNNNQCAPIYNGRRASEVHHLVESDKRKASMIGGLKFRAAVGKMIDEEKQLEPEVVPSLDDLRRMFVKNPTAMHHTYDKNLTHTDDRDLVHHLQQKQMRTERYACRVRADSLSMSPGNSVHGSMEHVYGGNRRKFDVIAEDTDAEAASEEELDNLSRTKRLQPRNNRFPARARQTSESEAEEPFLSSPYRPLPRNRPCNGDVSAKSTGAENSHDGERSDSPLLDVNSFNMADKEERINTPSENDDSTDIRESNV